VTGKSADKALDISIMGRTYKVNCADEEREALLEAVSYLDQKMNEIKSGGRVGSLERIAVMAALNIAHEYLTTRVGGGFDIADFRRRISGMEATIDQAVADQDELF
jgi:cell division protein ZapA